MSWLEGIALVGLAGMLAPLILHFLGRPKPVERLFPAVQFLLRKRLPAARVYSLREILILFLRVGLIGMGVLVVAGPIVPFPLPTCTERGEVDRDVVILLDNSPLSGYRLPELPGGEASVFDLYRDLALQVVSRVASPYHISVVPVDHRACPSVSRSPYHNEVAGVLRVGRVGDYGSHKDAYGIAYSSAVHPELRRPALLALTLAQLPVSRPEDLLLVQARPLAGISPIRNHALTSIESAIGGSPFGRHELVCQVSSTAIGRPLAVLLESEGGVLDEQEVRVGKDGLARAAVGFIPSRIGEERLRITLLPEDRLPYDNKRQVVFVCPGWPQVEWLAPSGRPRFRAVVEAIQSFAAGFGTGNKKVFLSIASTGGNGAEALTGVAEEVSHGAALVVFVEAFPTSFNDVKGVLPARPGRSVKADEAADGEVQLASLLAERLAAAGIGSGREALLSKVLSEVRPASLEACTGAVALAWRGEQLLALMRPYGQGRVLLWNIGDMEGLLKRSAGTAVPLIVESLFLASDWQASVRHGEVGAPFQMFLGFKPGNIRLALKAPSEDIFRPLYASRAGSWMPGFVPTEAGFWLLSVENPPREPDLYAIAVDPPPAPPLAPMEQLATPEEALQALGEAERAHLAGPLCALFLFLVALEALASNLLYRRVSLAR